MWFTVQQKVLLYTAKLTKRARHTGVQSQKIDMSTFNPSEFGTMLSELSKSLSGLGGISNVAKMKEFLDEKMSCLTIMYPCSAWQSLFNMLTDIGSLPFLERQDRKGSPPSFRDENCVTIMKRNKMNFMEDGVPLWERLTSYKVPPFFSKVRLSCHLQYIILNKILQMVPPKDGKYMHHIPSLENLHL